MTLMNRSAVRCRSNQAITPRSRCGLRSSDKRPCRRGTLEIGIARTHFEARGFAAILRHREQQFREGWCLGLVKALKTLLLRGIDYHDGRLAMFGDGLRHTACSLNNLAEPIFCVLDRPFATAHRQRPKTARLKGRTAHLWGGLFVFRKPIFLISSGSRWPNNLQLHLRNPAFDHADGLSRSM
jgi:hypothetical protein